MDSTPDTNASSLASRTRARVFGGPAGKVFSGMATLALGTGAAKGIALLAIPILTRLYSPEDFGALAVFTAFITILAPVITLRYVLAIPLPRRDGMAINLMALSGLLMLGMCAILAVMLWAFGGTLLGWFSMEALAPYWWLIVIGLVGASSYELLSLWATRKRAYKPIARTVAFQGVAGEAVKIALGLVALKPLGLLVGQVVTASAGTTALSRRFWDDFKQNYHYVSYRRMALLAGRYRNFPIFRLPSQFLLVVATKAPLLFTAAIYDSGTTGQLGLAFMALALPMAVLANTMSKAYFAEISAVGPKNPEEIKRITYSVVWRLGGLSLLPAFALFIFGPWAFEVAFGAEWRRAGVFASLLSVYLFFQFLQSPVSKLLFVFEGHRLLLVLNIQRVLLVAACFGVAVFFDMDSENMVFLYSLVMSFHYLMSILVTIRSIPK